MMKGTEKTTGRAESGQRTSGVSLVLTLWFLLTTVAFWGPYLGLSAFAPMFTALYGMFLLIVVAWGVLGFLRNRSDLPPDSTSEGDAQP